MIKKIFKLLKRVVFALVVLYSYNILAQSMDMMIPINCSTIAILSILGMPSLFVLILISVLVY